MPMSVKRNSPNASVSNPLESQQYFSSPIGTLLESLQDPQSEYITLHDLAQAYATVSRRIRLQAATILLNDRIYPALTIFRTHNASISTCLLRDIGRCLLSPLIQLSPSESGVLDDIVYEAGRAQAYATLSHHALVFLSDVFSLTPIMNDFSAEQLKDLLKELLVIISNPKLPTPSSSKTWSLAVWVLISQRLTEEVLASQKKEIKDRLLQMIQGGFGDDSPRVDGLKLFSALFQPSTESFHFSVLPLYPSILRLLTKDNLDIQSQALKAILAIVKQKLCSPTKDWTKVTTQTRAYIVSQVAKHKTSQQSSLQDVLSSAMKNQGDKWDHKGPLWALLLTGCLICLSDKDVFTHPHSLKLFLTALGKATNHQNPHVRALHPHIWNCLIWCYWRLPLTQELQDGQKLTDVRQRAFLVLRQDLKGGIATALVAALYHPLSKSESSTMSSVVSSIIDIIKSLLSHSRLNRLKEAVHIQNRLISTSSSPSAPAAKDLSSFISTELFSDSLLDMQEEAMKGVITRLARPAISLIPTLPEKLVFQRWDAFVDIWVRGMKCTLEFDDNAITFWDELLNIWQTLLLVRSQLAPNSTLLTISSQTCDRVKTIITGFISATDDVQKQLRQLRVVDRLWSVLKESYGNMTLISLAEPILSAVLAQTYTLQKEEVKMVWGKLCSNLMVVIQPSFLHTVFSRSPSQKGVAVQRQLWVTMAKSDMFLDRDAQEIVEFLGIPLNTWKMDPNELEIWTRLFERAIDVGRAHSGMQAHALVISLLKSMGKLDDIVSGHLVVVLPALLRHISFDDTDAWYGKFLEVVNVILLHLYPPIPEDHIRAISILEGVAHLVESTNEEHITTLLCLLQDSLCIWIKDESRVLLESEHTVIIRDIYCAALITLAKAPPSLERLQDLSPFFAASFERIGHPATGPCAFAQFWRSTYHTQNALKQMIPEDLRVCLKAWSDHCEDSLGDGIPSITDSQSTSKSIISDSQLSPVKIVPDSDPMDDYNTYSLMIPSDDFVDLEMEEANAASTPKARTPEVTTPKASTRELSHTDVIQPSISSNTTNSAGKRNRVEDDDHPSPKRVRIEGNIHIPSIRATETEVEPQRVASRSISINDSSTGVGPSILPLPLNVNTISFRTPQHRHHRRKIIVPFIPHQEEIEVVPETSSPLPISPIPTTEKVKEKEKGKGKEKEISVVGLGKRKAVDFDEEIVEDSTEIDPFFSPLNSARNDPRYFRNSPTKRFHSEPDMLHSPTKPKPTTLRRTHTSSSSSSSSRINALEHAYKLLFEVESQVPEDELADTANIVQRLSAKVNEQITKKLRQRK